MQSKHKVKPAILHKHEMASSCRNCVDECALPLPDAQVASQYVEDWKTKRGSFAVNSYEAVNSTSTTEVGCRSRESPVRYLVFQILFQRMKHTRVTEMI